MVSGTDVESTSIFRDSHNKNAYASISLSKNYLAIYTKFLFSANGGWGSSESISQNKFITTYSMYYKLSV